MRVNHLIHIPAAAGLLFLPLLPLAAQTVTPPKESTGLVQSGKVDIEAPDGTVRTIEDGGSGSGPGAAFSVKPGELIRTTSSTFCDVLIPSVGTVRVAPGSEVRIPAKVEENPRERHSLELKKGKLYLNVDAVKLKREQKQQFRLKTPTTILAVRGTHLFAETKDGIDTAGVHKGQIAVLEVQSGKVTQLPAGKAVAAKPGALARSRMLTAEERKEASVYDRFHLEQSLIEKPAKREAEAK